MNMFFEILYGSPFISYLDNKWTFDGSTHDLHWLSVTYSTLYGPICIYSNGRTYLVTKTNPYTANQRPGIVEYYNGNASIQFMDRDNDSEDRHDAGRLVDDGTGRITLLMEQHNPAESMGVVEVWRMSAANDITSFVYKGLSSEFGDYCKPYFRSSDGSIICIGRRDPLSVGGDGNLYMSIYDNDVTWSSPVQITEHQSTAPPVGTVDDLRYYPTWFQGNDGSTSDWRYLFFARRLGSTDVGNHIYREHLVIKFKLSDPYVIYNLTGSFSKDVEVGHITWDEMLANFVFTTNTVAVGGVSNGLIEDNKIYVRVIIDGAIKTFYFDGVNDFVELSNKIGGSYLDLNAAIVDDVTNAQIRIMRNLELINDINIDAPANGVWQMAGPANFNAVPKKQKFAIFAGSFKNSNGSDIDNPNENDIYVYEMIK